jgi:hypothetical protein
MSRRDLEEYWEKRERFTSNPSIEAAYDPDKMKEFLEYKERVEAELGAKDARALRAVRISGQISRGEAGYIVEELYPDVRLRPENAALMLSMTSQHKICMRLYDMFVETAFDAAAALAPL